MTKLRMAVVGVGALGQHHARILSQLEQVELVAVAETRAEIGRSVAEKCGTRWVADYQDLLDQVDAVSVVVPTAAHLAVASDFLTRRIPVLLEKPLALNVEQGRILVKLSQNFDTLLQVGHIERFNAATQAAWPYCQEPKYIRSERFSPFPFRSLDIGVVLDLMIHDLDLVLQLVQSPLSDVEAFGISLMGGAEDTVQARLTFANGCIADLSASRINPTPRRALQVWSANGCVNIDFSKPEVVSYAPSDLLRYGMSPIERAQQPGADISQLKQDVFGAFLKVERPEIPKQDALTAELSSFVECVCEGKPPVVDGAQALQALTVADRILSCVDAHQWDGHAEGLVGPYARPAASLRKKAG
jgi:predicted dehydrogenase